MSKVYSATALTGGATGALDGIDGTALADKDFAVVVTSGVVRHYWLDADSALAESSPYIIAPDANAGTKRWIQVIYPSGVDGVDYWIDALNTYGSGTSFTHTTINTALSAISTSTKCTLLLRPGTWTIGANVDWSAYTNIDFKFARGAVLSHGAYTINIPSINAGVYQIFSGTGTVTLSGDVPEVYPEWWGIDGTSDDVQIQAAIDSLPNGGTVKLQAKTYTQSATIYQKTKVAIVGSGSATVLNTTADFGDTVQIWSYPTNPATDGERPTGLLIENMTFDGSLNTTHSVTVPGVTNARGHAICWRSVTKSAIRHNWFNNPAGDAVYLIPGYPIATNPTNPEDVEISDNFIYTPERNGITDGGGYRHIIKGNIIDGAKLFGIDVEPNEDSIVSDIILDSNIVKDSVLTGIRIVYSFVTTASKQGLTTLIGNQSIHNAIGIGVYGVQRSFSIVGGAVRRSTSYGIYISDIGGTSKVSISGVYLHGNADDAIKSTGGYVEIIGNTFSANTGDYMISLYDNIYSSVMGNHIRFSSTKNGIYTHSNYGTAVTGNHIDGGGIVTTNRGIVDNESDYGVIGENTIDNVSSGVNIDSSSASTTQLGNNYFLNVTTKVTDSRVCVGTVTLSVFGVSYIDSTAGAVTATLPDGVQIGQIKVIKMSNATASSTVSVTHHETSDPEVFTFAQVTDILILMWNGLEWVTINNQGAAV